MLCSVTVCTGGRLCFSARPINSCYRLGGFGHVPDIQHRAAGIKKPGGAWAKNQNHTLFGRALRRRCGQERGIEGESENKPNNAVGVKCNNVTRRATQLLTNTRVFIWAKNLARL